jgi:hypothetical protein
VFVISGAEDLVPAFQSNPDGTWLRDTQGNLVADEKPRDGYMVKRYRPRIEGLFARIERWTRISDGDTHWRSISKDNILTVYGSTPESRIADPADPSHVFSWLICQSYDDKGNAMVYAYAAENGDNVDLSQINERSRVRTANRYLKYIRYGNRQPLLIDPTQPSFRQPHVPAPDFSAANWMFEVVFDYGEGHYQEMPPDADGRIFAAATLRPPPNGTWPVRLDPFSTYRSCFEVRSYRLCRRVLLFHHFPDELGVDDCLVRSTDRHHLYLSSRLFRWVRTRVSRIRTGGAARLGRVRHTGSSDESEQGLSRTAHSNEDLVPYRGLLPVRRTDQCIPATKENILASGAFMWANHKCLLRSSERLLNQWHVRLLR